jgi:hypothetical protein
VAAPLVGGAMLVAGLALWLASRREPRAAAKDGDGKRAGVAAPTSDQTCRFTLTDEAGVAHTYGGPRTRQAAENDHEANIYDGVDGLSHGLGFGCTPAYGESGVVYFSLTIPPDALTPGRHSLKDGALMIDFSTLLPEGFSQRTYRGGGALELVEYGAKPGTRIKGSFTGKGTGQGKSIGVNAQFDFKL